MLSGDTSICISQKHAFFSLVLRIKFKIAQGPAKCGCVYLLIDAFISMQFGKLVSIDVLVIVFVDFFESCIV